MLASAEHVSFEDDSALGAGAEPADEFVSLIYDRPQAASDYESGQMMVRPLRGRVVEDSRSFAGKRVASGHWVRQDLTLAGATATVYSGGLEGGPNDRGDSMIVFLPDSLMIVQLWAPMDPEVVLEVVNRVE
ncbi:MAG: hypothetical protein M5U22_19285 [Thermoleophilia bacterium]|nr:hypothetical protein [Thermoleophilia bacterium]